MKNEYLSKTPHEHPIKFTEAFNSGDPNRVDFLYEADAIMIDKQGHFVTGKDRYLANASFLKLGIPIEEELKHVYITGDIAMLIIDWKIKGKSNDNQDIDFSGRATDVLRKGSDGYWRFVIDNPWGTSE